MYDFRQSEKAREDLAQMLVSRKPAREFRALAEEARQRLEDALGEGIGWACSQSGEAESRECSEFSDEWEKLATLCDGLAILLDRQGRGNSTEEVVSLELSESVLYGKYRYARGEWGRCLISLIKHGEGGFHLLARRIKRDEQEPGEARILAWYASYEAAQAGVWTILEGRWRCDRRRLMI